MALLISCWYCTEENGKLKYAKECLDSLIKTVDLTKHRLIIINQNSCVEAMDFLYLLSKQVGITVLKLNQNIGTARGINLGLQMREPNELCIKLDDDLIWHKKGWVEKMEKVIAEHPEIGIIGLKRDDITNPIIEDGNILYCDDIMGTCTGLNPLLLDKIGYYMQCSDKYGFDDTLISVRSLAAGFKNAFLKDVKITNLDEGGTEYTEWKKKEAGVYLQEVGTMCEMIKDGKLPYFYDGGFND